MGQLTIREADAGDHGPIDEAEAAAFGARGESVVALVHELRRTGAVRLELVAVAGEAVVGHLVLSRGWLDSKRRLVEVRVLSPLAVLPDHQRRGVGRALLQGAATAAIQQQVPAIFLEGDPAYYSQAGFVPATPAGFRAPSLRIPEPGFQVLLLPAHESWMDGTLVYSEAFWSLDMVGLR
jgi:putative acetyltransferase